MQTISLNSIWRRYNETHRCSRNIFVFLSHTITTFTACGALLTLWRPLTVHTEEEPLVVDDIAYDNESERNADPCTSGGCMWAKSADGKVYVPYVIAAHYCKYPNAEQYLLTTRLQTWHLMKETWFEVNQCCSFYRWISGSFSTKQLQFRKRDHMYIITTPFSIKQHFHLFGK